MNRKGKYSKQNRIQYLKNRDKVIQKSKDKWKNSPELIREYHIKSERKIRNRRIKYEYGITIEEYDEMLKKQNHVCAICLKKENHNFKNILSIDHDHVRNRVRGLLCHRCNVAIGLMFDSEDILLSAASYIKRNEQATI